MIISGILILSWQPGIRKAPPQQIKEYCSRTQGLFQGGFGSIGVDLLLSYHDIDCISLILPETKSVNDNI